MLSSRIPRVPPDGRFPRNQVGDKWCITGVGESCRVPARDPGLFRLLVGTLEKREGGGRARGGDGRARGGGGGGGGGCNGDDFATIKM